MWTKPAAKGFPSLLHPRWHESGSEGCGSQGLLVSSCRLVSWFFYSVLVPLRALLGYTGACWLHVMLPRAPAPSACRQRHHCRSGCHSSVFIYKEMQIQGGSSGDINGFSAHTHANNSHTHQRDLMEGLSSPDGFCWVFVAYRVGLSLVLWSEVSVKSSLFSSAAQMRASVGT